MHSRYLACRTARAISQTFLSQGKLSICLAGQPNPIMLERVEEAIEGGHRFGLQLVTSASGEGCEREPSPSPSDPLALDSHECISVGQPEPTSYKGDPAFEPGKEEYGPDPEVIAEDCVPFSAGRLYEENCCEGDLLITNQVDLYLRLTLLPRNALDSQLDSVARAFRYSSAGSVAFTSSPIAAAASKRLFQLFLTIISAFLLYNGIEYVNSASRWGYTICTHVRLIPIMLRDGSTPSLTPSYSDFGLLNNRCRIQPAGHSWTNGSLEVWYAKPVESNGIYVTTGLGSSSQDISQWAIESTESNWIVSTKRLLSTSYRMELPVLRDFDYVFDWTMEKLFALVLASNTLDFSAGFALSVVLGIAGRETDVAGVLAATFLLSTVVRSVAGLGFLWASGNWIIYSSIWVTTPQDLIAAIGIVFFEQRFISVLLVYSFVYVALSITRELVFSGTDWFKALYLSLSTSAIIAFALALCAHFLRFLAKHRAWKAVRKDKEQMDVMWKSMMNSAESLEQLAKIKQEACRLDRGCPAWIPVQRSGREWDPFSHPPRWLPAHRRDCTSLMLWPQSVLSRDSFVNTGQRLLSLDQLHLQATLMHPILLDKVKMWAAASNGCFPIGGQDDEGRAKIEKYDKFARFKWAKVKSVDRILEKTLRVYGKNTSRLVDICRQTIIFEHPSNLAECLRVISLDGETRVVRVKNRLDPAYNATLSAGYRDLALNLTLESNAAVAFGLEKHICELQLILLPIYQLKSDTGHANYIIFRNFRGE